MVSSLPVRKYCSFAVVVDDVTQISVNVKIATDQLSTEAAAQSFGIGEFHGSATNVSAGSRTTASWMDVFVMVGQSMLACISLRAIRAAKNGFRAAFLFDMPNEVFFQFDHGAAPRAAVMTFTVGGVGVFISNWWRRQRHMAQFLVMA